MVQEPLEQELLDQAVGESHRLRAPTEVVAEEQLAEDRAQIPKEQVVEVCEKLQAYEGRFFLTLADSHGVLLDIVDIHKSSRPHRRDSIIRHDNDIYEGD